MTNAILGLVQWAGAHPQLAGLLVALAACVESLAFIGIIFPGAVMILGAGALIGVGALEFWSTLAWAVGGAVVGDGVSYWLGHHYQDRLRRLRFVRTHPDFLSRAETFFRQHGGKSVLLARFVGPMRPVVPVVAGMLGMPPSRFYAYNVLSALAWAPAHLIPGMVFGASLAIAGEVTARLALILGLLLVSAWTIVWLVRAAYLQCEQHAGRWAGRALAWGQSHRWFAWLVADLFDPARPVSRSLLLWLIVLIAAVWLFFGVLEDVLNVDPLVYAGQAFYHLLQQLRTPLVDRVMVVLTEAGDAAVVVPLIAAVLLWLLWRRAWRDALYWLAAVGFGALAVATIKTALRMPRPAALYPPMDTFSFPSGHTTLSTVIFGYLAVLCARSMAPRWRWTPYTIAALLVSGIAFSRLYLGAHWLADVVAGVALGAAWVAILTIARARHPVTVVPLPGLAPLALVVFCAAAAWHVHGRFNFDLERYAVHVPVRTIGEQLWWDSDWQTLPAYRLDLGGERKQQLNIQWAGELRVLRQSLVAGGWHQPPALTPRTALHWLLPHASLDQLPMVPQLNNGQYESLVLVHAGDPRTHPDQQLVLRMWPTAVRLRGRDARVWIGTVAWQGVQRLPLVSFPHNANGYGDALERLRPDLKGLRWKIVQRPLHAGGENARPSGDTLLVCVTPK